MQNEFSLIMSVISHSNVLTSEVATSQMSLAALNAV